MMTQNTKKMQNEDTDYYYETLTCWNCCQIDTVQIGKGITIESYNDFNRCTNCGCHRRLK